MIYDGCGVMNEAKLNKVQYEAAKIVSGAIHGTSYASLLEELGWETLNSRRTRHKLCLFFDIMNGHCPSHMSSFLPQNVMHGYAMRHPQIPSTLVHTNRLYHSFVPSSIRLWNSLNLDIKQSTTIASFKSKLVQLCQIKKVPYYCYGPRQLNIALTRLRLNCSSLNSYLHRIGVMGTPACSCGARCETTHHYFLQCLIYETQRRQLDTTISVLAPFTLSTVLYGSHLCSLKENKTIVEAVYKFIKESKRFNLT